MTQREKLGIALLKNDAYYNYFMLCIDLNEVPRPDILILIKGCYDIQTLKETVNIFKSKL